MTFLLVSVFSALKPKLAFLQAYSLPSFTSAAHSGLTVQGATANYPFWVCRDLPRGPGLGSDHQSFFLDSPLACP